MRMASMLCSQISLSHSIHSQNPHSLSLATVSSFSRRSQMEEELQKRSTDCVYFLASPLTCKKGIDCEYRHSETARLNPRDCWYWLAGSCLNPTCAFRHPPLDGRPETASESAPSHNQPAATVNKANVPCYFYFNGFCNKGERCFYLHGPDETIQTWKSSKAASAAVDGPSLEKKMSTCSELVPVPVETQSSETVQRRAAGLKIKPEQELHQLPSNNVAAETASPQTSASPCEGYVAIRSSPVNPGEAFAASRSQESNGQSSDDQQLDPIEREEWLESSPGFDVLVNDRSEDFDCKDDSAYILHHDVEDRERYDQLLGYDYEENIEYDPAHPDLRISFAEEVHDSFHLVDGEDIHNSFTKFPYSEKERILDETLQRKRTSLQAELGSKGRSGLDLRDYLKKRRVVDGRYPVFSQTRDRSGMISRGHVHARLASKVEVYSVGSRVHSKSRLNDIYRPARSRRSRVSRSRKHFKEGRPAKQQNLSSEISGKITSGKRRFAEDSTVFTGPKSLAQIKEEKRRAQENGDSFT